jgi:hypothetical protein
MFQNFGQILFFVAGILGLFLLLAAIFLPGLSVTVSKRKNILDLEAKKKYDAYDVKTWSLLARLMYSLSRSTGKRQQSPEDLMTRLVRSGLRYYSPQHYYSQQMLGALLMFGVGFLFSVIAGLFTSIPFWAMAAMSLGLALYGFTLPANEVANAIKKRRLALLVDMTYSLPRLVLAIQKYGNIFAAMREYSANNVPLPAEVEAEQGRIKEKELGEENAEVRQIVARAFSGFGGHEFARLVNEIAAAMSETGADPRATIEIIRDSYPDLVEKDIFLDIILGGLGAEQVAASDRLRDFAGSLRKNHRQRIVVAGQSAGAIVSATSAMQLLPIIVIIGAPIVSSLTMFFGGS